MPITKVVRRKSLSAIRNKRITWSPECVGALQCILEGVEVGKRGYLNEVLIEWNNNMFPNLPVTKNALAACIAKLRKSEQIGPVAEIVTEVRAEPDKGEEAVGLRRFDRRIFEARFAETFAMIHKGEGDFAGRTSIVLKRVKIPQDLLEVVAECVNDRIDSNTDLWKLKCLVYSAARVVEGEVGVPPQGHGQGPNRPSLGGDKSH